MNRRQIVGVLAGCLVVLVLLAGVVAVLMRTGAVRIESNLSSGSADDSDETVKTVGYEGVTAPNKTTVGAMVKRDLDRIGGPPNLLLPPETRVKVVTADPDAAEVIVLEGNSHGLKPWIHWEDLR